MGLGFLQFWRILALDLLEFRCCSLDATSVALLCESSSDMEGSGVLWGTSLVSNISRKTKMGNEILEQKTATWSHGLGAVGKAEHGGI